MNPTRRHIHLSMAGFAVRLAIRDPLLYDKCLAWACGVGGTAKPGVGRAAVTIEISDSLARSASRVPDNMRLNGYGEYDGMFDADKGRGAVALTGASPAVSFANCLRQVCIRLVLANGGLALHAASVARNGRAYVFCGRSGAGKTTICELSPRDTILNDDLTVIRRVNGSFLAWGFPSPTAQAFPVAALFRLVQATRNRLRPLTGAKAVAQMAIMPPSPFLTPETTGKTLELLGELVEIVPCYDLHFRKDPSFWRCIERRLGRK